MARLFNDASNEYLRYDAGLVAGAPVTLACWFNSDTIALNQTLMALVEDQAVTPSRISLQARGDKAGDPVRIYTTANAAASFADTTSGYGANAWHHACGVEATSTDRRVYIDGGNKGIDVGDRTPDNLDFTCIGAIYNGVNPSFLISGNIAEAAIWNIALTDAEVAILAKGFSPLFVRPQNLVAYWPLIRDEDQDRVGDYDMTAFNTPSIAVHPSIFYPAPLSIIVPTAGAPPTNAMPMAMHHYRIRRAA